MVYDTDGNSATGEKIMQIELIDDGTLDRVYACTCNECGHTWRERFHDITDDITECGLICPDCEDCE